MLLPRGKAERDPGVLAAIGNTPLVRLAGPDPPIFAKLEGTNPGGSVKDRLARYILQEAVRTRRVGPGHTVVAFAGGNLAVSIAMVSAALELRAVLVTAGLTRAQAERIAAYGARVVAAACGVGPEDPGHGTRVARRLAEAEGAFLFDQFHNPLNAQAHYLSTGPEIWRQTAGQVDVLVAGVGTGGTLSGTARFLRERTDDLHVVAVDPEGSILADYMRGLPLGRPGSWEVDGIGSDMVCRALDRTMIDEVVTVSDAEAFAEAGRTARRLGLLVGGSAGAALWAARQVAERRPRARAIVAIVPDAAYLAGALPGALPETSKRRHAP